MTPICNYVMCNGPFENVMYIQLTNCKSQSSQTGVKIVKTCKINIFWLLNNISLIILSPEDMNINNWNNSKMQFIYQCVHIERGHIEFVIVMYMCTYCCVKWNKVSIGCEVCTATNSLHYAVYPVTVKLRRTYI